MAFKIIKRPSTNYMFSQERLLTISMLYLKPKIAARVRLTALTEECKQNKDLAYKKQGREQNELSALMIPMISQLKKSIINTIGKYFVCFSKLE